MWHNLGRARARLLCALLFGSLAVSACDQSEKSASGTGNSNPQEGRGIEVERAAAGQRTLSTAKTDSKPGPAAVNLAGESSALAVTEIAQGPRIYARELRAWILEEPRAGARKLGYLRAGSSSPTSEAAVGTEGCKGGWYPVQPRGFLCRGASATLDPKDVVVRAFESHPPRSDERLPYRYGTVRKPGPMYGRLPTSDEVTASEPGYAARMREWLQADGDIGASFRQDVWTYGKPPLDPKSAFDARLSEGIPEVLSTNQNLPSVLSIHRPTTVVIDTMPPRAGHAFLDTFFSEGRRYGLTTQLEVVPTDRYRPLVGSEFHGVELGKEIELPLAFVRRVGAKFADGSKAEYQKVLPLTGKKKFLNSRLHYETKDGKYISDLYASEVTLAEKMPGWAKKGERWINISILAQTLVLYEGEKAVYATLVSTGEAGLDDPDASTATKRGIFRIHTKHVTATMASDEVGEEFELRDVPYVQYFAEGGFALHGAYWHDRFGTPKSHGCINLSPEDARRIFYFTEPEVPPGWHGALLPLRGTVVFIHP